MAVAERREAQARALWLSLAANGVVMVIEAVFGFLLSSLALLADAAHMLSDVAALTIAIGAQRLMTRPASGRHTYGLQRAEVLAAAVNGLLLLVAAGWIFFEAFGRLSDPPTVDGTGILLVGALGFLVNVGSAVILFRVRTGSLNVRAAYLHMLSDALGSVGAMAAGLAVIGWNAYVVDPIASIAIGVLVVWSTRALILDAAQVLLEGTPRGLDVTEVERALATAPGVDSVHHIHVWNLASDVRALSAHVVIEGEISLHDAQERGDRLKVMLADRFGIDHATLELECHSCE
jgi:cobalt-zinc-cadmium efflux system protein